MQSFTTRTTEESRVFQIYENNDDKLFKVYADMWFNKMETN